MHFDVYRTTKKSALIEEYFELSFNKESIPFHTKIIPIALPTITHINKGQHNITSHVEKFQLKNIVLSGIFLKAYELNVVKECTSFGFNLHPSALYKIFNTDISKLENKHISLKKFSPNTYSFFEEIFNSNIKGEEAINEIEKRVRTLPLTINIHTKNADKAISIIRQKDGLLNVSHLLEEIRISQKTLETKFKQIIGITPGKYIKIYRFVKLMHKYERQEIKLKELIHMYDYYDESHFAKDFKSFMTESIKSFFDKDREMLKKYLK